MLKLSKYEFRKNRNFLLVIGIIFALLEIYFLVYIYEKPRKQCQGFGVFVYLCCGLLLFRIYTCNFKLFKGIKLKKQLSDFYDTEYILKHYIFQNVYHINHRAGVHDNHLYHRIH